MKKNLLGWVLLTMMVSWCARGHEGPPYPILVDHPMDGISISVWTDPDLHDGTFFIYAQLDKQNRSDVQVSLAANNQVLSLPIIYAKRNMLLEKSPERQVYEAHIPFPELGLWKVSLSVNGNLHDMNVDVTPPGPRFWEFLLYLMPFLAFGFIWLKMLVMRRKLPE